MPFGKSLQVDMEVRHWKQCDISYAAATYWYGDADTKTNRKAESDEVTLRAEVVGKNAKSENTDTYFALDCVVNSKETDSTASQGGK